MSGRDTSARVDELLMQAFDCSRQLARHVALRGLVLLDGQPLFRYGWEKVRVRVGAKLTDSVTGYEVTLEGWA